MMHPGSLMSISIWFRSLRSASITHYADPFLHVKEKTSGCRPCVDFSSIFKLWENSVKLCISIRCEVMHFHYHDDVMTSHFVSLTSIHNSEQPMPTKDTVANFNPLLLYFTYARPKRLNHSMLHESSTNICRRVGIENLKKPEGVR